MMPGLLQSDPSPDWAPNVPSPRGAASTPYRIIQPLPCLYDRWLDI